MRAAVWILAILVAGCSEPATAPDDEDGDGLRATVDTGVLRGIVVDETLSPVPAEVEVLRNNALVATLTTQEAGFFGMDGLTPGLYVVRTGPSGFFAAQETTTVRAGIEEPEVVKLVLQRDVQEARFAIQHVWDGHMVCAATGGNYCALPRLYTGIDPFNDNSVRLFYHEFVDVGRQPTFVQGEVVWESTQAVTPTLQNRWTATDPEMIAIGSWNYTYGWGSGASPIIFPIDEATIQESRLGRDMGLNIEMFASTPGVVLDQPFTIYITAFYGYTPPEGWRFVDTSSVPPP